MPWTKGVSRIPTLCLLLAAGWAAAASPAFGFRMIGPTGLPVPCNSPGGFKHWEVRNINWHHNTAGQGAGKASALQAALSAWTNVPGGRHVLGYAGTTTAGFAVDGRNTLLWATGGGCSGSCLALTALTTQSSLVIVEADTMFNAALTWNTTGADFDVRSVATHELGHAIGIAHTELTTTPRPTMYAVYFGTGMRTLEADDRAAAQCQP